MGTTFTMLKGWYDDATEFISVLVPQTTEYGYMFVSVVVSTLALYLLISYVSSIKRLKEARGIRRVLLVTAHPDDECMFFGPTITALSKTPNMHLYLLCLTAGDYDDRGMQRKHELWASCKMLGIPEENIFLIRHSEIKDGQQYEWPTTTIASIVLDLVAQLDIDAIFTFDAYGVSGHNNHSCISTSLHSLYKSAQYPKGVRMFFLESFGIVRKYSIFFVVPLSYLASSLVYIASLKDRRLILKAMREHHSQLVWFRWLYMRFSCYVFVNCWMEVQDCKLHGSTSVEVTTSKLNDTSTNMADRKDA